ncbi:MAG: hydantoinase B/oxoprolinase family protein, partial [Candidatus Heimdallarchaeota archaeon]
NALKDGVDGIHTNMTNTMNTPIEEIEVRYPLIVEQYSLRENSGGSGKHRGGLGVIRKFKALAPVVVNLLGERQKTAPWGLAGGEDGTKGKYYKITAKNERVVLAGKTATTLQAGETLVIETPGGGGFGDKRERTQEQKRFDTLNEKMY